MVSCSQGVTECTEDSPAVIVMGAYPEDYGHVAISSSAYSESLDMDLGVFEPRDDDPGADASDFGVVFRLAWNGTAPQIASDSWMKFYEYEDGYRADLTEGAPTTQAPCGISEISIVDSTISLEFSCERAPLVPTATNAWRDLTGPTSPDEPARLTISGCVL